MINTGTEDARVPIAYVEEKYNCHWVGQLPLKDKYGNWQTDSCADIYYHENPPNGYSKYLGIILRDVAYITSGASAVEGEFTGIVADDGEIIYSRYDHDYRVSTDGSVWIDGGRSYTRCLAGSTYVRLHVVDGVIKVQQ
jgi:hypothetical protein